MYSTSVLGRILVNYTKYSISNLFFYSNYLIQTIGHSCFKYCILSPYYFFTKHNSHEPNDYDIEKDIKCIDKNKKVVTFQPELINNQENEIQPKKNHNSNLKSILQNESNLYNNITQTNQNAQNEQNTTDIIINIDWDIIE
jgi:hypothetical protein